MFIDGVEVGSYEISPYGGEFVGSHSAPFYIGDKYNGLIDGNIDVFKFDKGICRHTSDFTPPANEDVDNDEYYW
jgi:hypothetical protein